MQPTESETQAKPAHLRIVLGTAQFDAAYGIARKSVHLPIKLNSSGLLAEAARLGLQRLDTAPAYGSAESIIGASNWVGEVATKIDHSRPPDESLNESLTRLQRNSVETLYLHNYSAVRNGDFIAAFRELRSDRVNMLGASIYELTELRDGLDRDCFSIFQVPLNLFDRRFVAMVAEGEKAGIRFVARSVLLQGLLATGGLEAATQIPDLKPYIGRFVDLCRRLDRRPEIVAIQWVLSQMQFGSLVVGFDTADQLTGVLQGLAGEPLPDNAIDELNDLPLPPRNLVDPRLWNWR